MPPMRDRPTQEIVVLILTVTVSIILIIGVFMLLVTEIRNPEVDTSGITRSFAQVISTLIAAIIGYIAGRGYNSGPPDA